MWLTAGAGAHVLSNFELLLSMHKVFHAVNVCKSM